MAIGTETLTDGPGSRATGVVSGFVLKLARQSAALTQEKLAAALTVDVSTVQGWESGRRPLASVHAGEFVRLSRRPSRLGAPASTGRHLREAIEADQILSTGIVAGSRWVNPDTHPLAASVNRRSLTNLITWPIDGQIPQHLQVFNPTSRRRGPAPTTPALSVDERTRFLDHLLTVAERAGHANEALLRRQAVYLLGFDARPHITDWLRADWRRAGRRPATGVVTSLLEARSAGVALASAGDPSHLHEFVDRMTGNAASEIANLNYWAHWIGELGDDHADDTFMLEHDTRSWTGVQLLKHLIYRLDPHAAHLRLNLHTLHTLIATRPGLLRHRPAVQDGLTAVLDRLSDSDEPSRAVRGEIAGLRYALRLADR